MVSVPVWLGSSTGEPGALVRDMSADGVFFYTHSKLIVGADIRFTAKLPLGYVALSEVRALVQGAQ